MIHERVGAWKGSRSTLGRTSCAKGLWGGQTVVRGAQTPAGAFALVLEADAPVGALDALAISLDANRSEEVESLPPRNHITVFYAIVGAHDKPSYANLWQGSSLETSIDTGATARLC